MNHKSLLIDKISNHSAIVGIVGLGYVGLPLALEFVSKGFNVIGFDVDEKKIPILNSGKSYIKHISEDRIKHAIDSKLFLSTFDFSLLPSCDAILICVPTPLDEHREPDMSYVVNTAKTIQKYLRPGQLITLESTTYPGTTEEVLRPIFEQAPGIQNSEFRNQKSESGRREDGKTENKEKDINESDRLSSDVLRFNVGEDFFLAFSPEREDPNNPDYSTATIPKVVGGVTENCLEVAKLLYDQIIVKTVPVSSTQVAEATKLLENIYRSVNIALVNELKCIFGRMNIDVWEVIEAAKTKPFGFNAFYPGPGLGGHCIPIDPFYLSWKAKEYDIDTKFITLAGEINTNQPYYVVQKAMDVMNDNDKSLKGSKVLILGAAYKKNIDDLRESPSLKLIDLLYEHGAEVDYNDPYVPVLPYTRKYQFDMKSVALTDANLSSYDLIILSTDHDDYDTEYIYKHANLIIDTRNAFKTNGLSNGKVTKA